MGLKNYQYNAIMREYDERQSAARYLLEKRQEEVEAKIPAYRELEQRIIDGSIRCAEQLLLGGEDTLHELREENKRLSEQKKELLASAGFPADYLTPAWPVPGLQRHRHDW